MNSNLQLRRRVRVKQRKQRDLRLEILETRRLLVGAISNPLGQAPGINLPQNSRLAETDLIDRSLLLRRDLLSEARKIDNGYGVGIHNNNEVDRFLPDFETARLEFGPAIPSVRDTGTYPYDPDPIPQVPLSVSPEAPSPILSRNGLDARNLYQPGIMSAPELRPYSVDTYNEEEWMFDVDSIKHFFPDIIAWSDVDADQISPPTTPYAQSAGNINVVEEFPDEGKTVSYDLQWNLADGFSGDLASSWSYSEDLLIGFTITTQWYDEAIPVGLPAPDEFSSYGVPDPSGAFADYIQDNGIQSGPEFPLVRQRLLQQFGTFELQFSLQGDANGVTFYSIDEFYEDNFDDWYFESLTPDTLPGETIYESYGYLATVRDREQHDVILMNLDAPAAAPPPINPSGTTRQERVESALEPIQLQSVLNDRSAMGELQLWHDSNGFTLPLPIPTGGSGSGGYGYGYGYDYSGDYGGDYGYDYGGDAGYDYNDGYGYGYDPDVYVRRFGYKKYKSEFNGLTSTDWDIAVSANPDTLNVHQDGQLYDAEGTFRTNTYDEQFITSTWDATPPEGDLSWRETASGERSNYWSVNYGEFLYDDQLVYPNYDDSASVDEFWQEVGHVGIESRNRLQRFNNGTTFDEVEYGHGHDDTTYWSISGVGNGYLRATIRPDGNPETAQFYQSYIDYLPHTIPENTSLPYSESLFSPDIEYIRAWYTEHDREETATGHVLNAVTWDMDFGDALARHNGALEGFFELASADPSEPDDPDFFTRYQRDDWAEEVDDVFAYDFHNELTDYGTEIGGGVQSIETHQFAGGAQGLWRSDAEGYYNWFGVRHSENPNLPGNAKANLIRLYGNGWEDMADARPNCYDIDYITVDKCGPHGGFRHYTVTLEQLHEGFSDWFDDDRFSRTSTFGHEFDFEETIKRDGQGQIVTHTGVSTITPLHDTGEFGPVALPLQTGTRDEATYWERESEWDSMSANSDDVRWADVDRYAYKNAFTVEADGDVHSKDERFDDGSRVQTMNEKGATAEAEHHFSFYIQKWYDHFLRIDVEDVRDYVNTYQDEVNTTIDANGQVASTITFEDFGLGTEFIHAQWEHLQYDTYTRGYEFTTANAIHSYQATVDSTDQGDNVVVVGSFAWQGSHLWVIEFDDTSNSGLTSFEGEIVDDPFVGPRSGRTRVYAWCLKPIPFEQL